MLKINYRITIIRPSNSIYKSIETNTSTQTNITWEIQLQTIITRAQFWKIKERMMKPWGKLTKEHLPEDIIQDFTQMHIFDMILRENLFGRRKRGRERWQPKKRSNSYIPLKTMSEWKILYGKEIKHQEQNFETKDQSSQNFGTTATSLKYPCSRTMPLTPRTLFCPETSRLKEKPITISITYSMKAFFKNDLAAALREFRLPWVTKVLGRKWEERLWPL